MIKDFLREFAEEKGYQFQSYGDLQMVVVPCVGQRSQVVNATMINEGEEEERFLLYTVVGEMGPRLDLEEFIRIQMGWAYARFGVLSGDLVVCMAVPPENLLVDSGKEMVAEAIEEIAFVGDRLEEDLFSTDAS